MPAGTGQRRPSQDGADTLRRRHSCYVERPTGIVVERPFAVVLCVPNRQLAVEIAKAADRLEIEACCLRRSAQIQKGGDRLHMQHTRRFRHRHDVGPHPARQFEGVQGEASRAAANSATWSSTRAKLDGSWAPESVY